MLAKPAGACLSIGSTFPFPIAQGQAISSRMLCHISETLQANCLKRPPFSPPGSRSALSIGRLWRTYATCWWPSETLVCDSLLEGDKLDKQGKFFSRHPGGGRTSLLIKRDFWWEAIDKYLKEYVTACPISPLNKSNKQCPDGLLQLLTIPSSSLVPSFTRFYLWSACFIS